MSYLAMLPFVLWGAILGVETAIEYWVRWSVRRAVYS